MLISPRHNGARHYAGPGINVGGVHVELVSAMHETPCVAGLFAMYAVGLYESAGVAGLYTPVCEFPGVARLCTIAVALSLRVGLSGRVT